MFQEFQSPAVCFYIHEDHCRVYKGSMIGSNGERAVVDFGPGFGTAFPLLADLFAEELPALLELETLLQRRMNRTKVMIMALNGSLESVTVSPKYE